MPCLPTLVKRSISGVKISLLRPWHVCLSAPSSRWMAVADLRADCARIWNLKDQTAPPQAMEAEERLVAHLDMEKLVQGGGLAKLAPASRPSWSLRSVRAIEDRLLVATAAGEILQLAFDWRRPEHDEYGQHEQPAVTARTAGCGFAGGVGEVSVVCHPHKLECVTTGGGTVRRWDIDCWAGGADDTAGAPSARLSGYKVRAALCLKQSRRGRADCVCADYTPDGAYVAVGLSDGSVVVADSARLNLDANEVACGDDDAPVRALKFAPHAKPEGAPDLVLAVARGRPLRIDLVHFETRKVLSSVGCDGPGPAGVISLDWTQAGDVLMTSGVRRKRACRVDHARSIQIVSSDDGARVADVLASWSRSGLGAACVCILSGPALPPARATCTHPCTMSHGSSACR